MLYNFFCLLESDCINLGIGGIRCHGFSSAFEGSPANTKHLYNIYATSAQRLRRCPTLYKYYTNVVCLLGAAQQTREVERRWSIMKPTVSNPFSTKHDYIRFYPFY